MVRGVFYCPITQLCRNPLVNIMSAFDTLAFPCIMEIQLADPAPTEQDMLKIYHLLNDYSREPAVEVETLSEAKTWCRRDTATMFWPQDGGEIVAANKEREAIHVIVGFRGDA